MSNGISVHNEHHPVFFSMWPVHLYISTNSTYVLCSQLAVGWLTVSKRTESSLIRRMSRTNMGPLGSNMEHSSVHLLWRHAPPQKCQFVGCRIQLNLCLIPYRIHTTAFISGVDKRHLGTEKHRGNYSGNRLCKSAILHRFIEGLNGQCTFCDNKGILGLSMCIFGAIREMFIKDFGREKFALIFNFGIA